MSTCANVGSFIESKMSKYRLSTSASLPKFPTTLWCIRAQIHSQARQPTTTNNKCTSVCILAMKDSSSHSIFHHKCTFQMSDLNQNVIFRLIWRLYISGYNHILCRLDEVFRFQLSFDYIGKLAVKIVQKKEEKKEIMHCFVSAICQKNFVIFKMAAKCHEMP